MNSGAAHSHLFIYCDGAKVRRTNLLLPLPVPWRGTLGFSRRHRTTRSTELLLARTTE
jgi:hypothetical protein